MNNNPTEPRTAAIESMFKYLDGEIRLTTAHKQDLIRCAENDRLKAEIFSAYEYKLTEMKKEFIELLSPFFPIS